MPAVYSKANKKKKDNLGLRIIHGRLLSIDFFRHHWLSVMLAVAMVMIYITNRYQCLTRMEHIRALEQELEIVETERIRVKSIDAGDGRHYAP